MAKRISSKKPVHRKVTSRRALRLSPAILAVSGLVLTATLYTVGQRVYTYIASRGNINIVTTIPPTKLSDCFYEFSLPTPTPTPTPSPSPSPSVPPSTPPSPSPSASASPTPPPQCNKSLDIMLVFDRSNTMTDPADPADPSGPTKLDKAREAGTTFISQLKNTGTTSVRLGISSFGAQGNDGTGKLTPPYNSTLHSALLPIHTQYMTIQSAMAGVQYILPGTCVLCGIRIANQQLLPSTNVRAEILLSDGMTWKFWDGHGGDQDAKDAAIAEAKIAKDAGVDMWVVGYGDRNVPDMIDEVTLKAISSNPDTRYFYRPDPTEWSATFTKILGDLCK